MNTCDIYRYLAMTIRENCARVRYSDDGRRVDVSGAWGDCVGSDDLDELRKANAAIYRAWIAGVNGDRGGNRPRLERQAGEAMKKARAIVAGWGKSPAGGWCEIDEETAANAGALVLVCHDDAGTPRGVDFSYYFGRGCANV